MAKEGSPETLRPRPPLSPFEARRKAFELLKALREESRQLAAGRRRTRGMA